MPVPIYTQAVIAVIWDFDKTLIPGYQQDPLFARFGVNGGQFWDEVNGLVDAYAKRGVLVGDDTAYLGHILTYVNEGPFAGLTNELLFELGAELEMCPGVPEIMDDLVAQVATNPRYQPHDITLEHYIVSTGLLKMIEGSRVGSKVNHIWANEFISGPLPKGYLEILPTEESDEIAQLGYVVDNTSKTRAVFEINKGVNIIEGVHVNDQISLDDRRVPIKNMIYVADGPSDVPVFSILNQNGGKTLGVFQDNDVSFADAKSLEDQGRVQSIAEADYSKGRQAQRWLSRSVEQIADEIVATRERYFRSRPGAPSHSV